MKTPKADRIFETILYAEDLERVRPFYEEVLGLDLFEESPLFLVFKLSSGVLLIFNPKESELPDRPIPRHGAYGPGHVAFAASPQSIEAWRTHFARHRIGIEKEVEWGSGGTSLYVRDPAGNSVELAPPNLWGGRWDF